MAQPPSVDLSPDPASAPTTSGRSRLLWALPGLAFGLYLLVGGVGPFREVLAWFRSLPRGAI